MWVKLSDDWYDNPKFQSVTALAELLYLRCLAWSCRNLTDGFLPHEATRRLLPRGVIIRGRDAFELDRQDPDLYAPILAGSLVEVGLWEEAAGGYRIHDFFDFNKPRARILEERRKDLARKATTNSGRTP